MYFVLLYKIYIKRLYDYEIFGIYFKTKFIDKKFIVNNIMYALNFII
jgi:hypothetical protein